MAGGSSRNEEPITAINVTPLVDVCLVLVIIFMAVAPMAITLGIKVLESRASTAEGKASVDDNVSIKIALDGSITVNGTKTDGMTFRGVLADALSRSKDRLVVVTADARDKVGLVVSVLDASKQAGAQKLALMKAPGEPDMAAESLNDEEPITDINITPLVDVCLVLVIIFMVTAPMFSEPAIKVDLPSAHTREGEERDKVTLTLSKDGQYALDYEKFASADAMMPRLKEKLAESDSKLVILRADKDADYGPLTDLMARAKDAGARSMTIETETPK